MKKTKRGLSLLLAFSMLVSMIPYSVMGHVSAAENAVENAWFTDMPAGHWAYEYVSDVTSRGLFLGTGDGSTFSPEEPMTRAMFVTVLSRMDGAEVYDSASTGFSDVPAGTWYTGAVEWAVDAGVTEGNGSGAFLPEQAIDREQVAAMLVRYCGYAGIELEETEEAMAFTDAASISGWATEAVTACQRSGLMTGYTDGSFGPARQVQRAEVAAVMSRLAAIAEPGAVPAESFRIRFDSNGGSQVEDQVVEAGKLAERPEDPTRSGYRFDGWYSDGELKEKYDFSKPVSADLTLYAKWTGTGDDNSSGEESVEEPGDGFVLFDGTNVPDIYVSAEDYPQVVRVADDLQLDVERVTEHKPEIKNTTDDLSQLAIIVGSVEKSPVIRDIMDSGKLDEAQQLKGKWESYLLKIVDEPIEGVDKALVIAGSDKRGTIYGVYDLSEQIGVSPWYYWGDITPKVQSQIIIDQPLKMEGEPSVKYRGIFINDEQALVQWATIKGPDAANGGNLGPETYKSIYELILRLKGNYLWPGMHSETRLGENVYTDDPEKAKFNATDYFNKYPENRENADLYGVVVGTSHCEPMMRNGTAEWGEFLQQEGYLEGVDFKSAIGKNKVDAWMYNYNSSHEDKIPRYDYSEMVNTPKGDMTQREFINKYWNESVEAYKDYEVSYTLGMRGVHDEGFRFANTNNDQTKLEVLQDVIDAQVAMLEDNDVSEEAFPIFIPYKEVLPMYNEGLELPEDTIIVWADDNFGYNRRYPTAEETEKYAGSGIYYHMSYEGAPLRYQWMNSTPPAQMLSELSKAYESGIQSLWVLNVGDIKPSEIGIEFFLDMAWDIDKWNDANLQDPESGFLTQLAAKWFPELDSSEVGAILEEYFRLNYDRKPHHTNTFTFNATDSGDEAMQRVADFQDIALRTQKILDSLEGDKLAYDQFFQLVGYQVLAANCVNLKYFYAQKAELYDQQGRAAAANRCQELIGWVQDQEDALTEYYNTGAFDGKWELMMQPGNFLRGNPVSEPSVSVQTAGYFAALGLAVEGQTSLNTPETLQFSSLLKDTHYIDVFNQGAMAFDFTISADQDWVKISETEGTIYDEQRIFITIDWANLPAGDQTATITVDAGDAGSQSVKLSVSHPAGVFNGYVEANGYVAIEAEHYTENVKQGNVGFVDTALGHSGTSISARPMTAARYTETDYAPYVTYTVNFTSTGTFPVTVYRIPTLDEGGQRVALQWDDGEVVTFTGGTTTESSGWGSNVEHNLQRVTCDMTISDPGVHTLKMYMVDPGVVIDRIVIDTGSLPSAELGPKESYHSQYNPDPAWTPKLLSLEPAALDGVKADVAAKIAELGGDSLATFLQSELDAVKEALTGTIGDDTVRRCYARLEAALAKVEAESNIDALWADAQARADALMSSVEGTADYGIPVYDRDEAGAFQSKRNELEASYAAATTDEQRLELYTQLMSAIVSLKPVITITASSQESNHQAEKIMDGKGTAGTSGDDRWAASGSGEGQWVLIDLQEPYDLTGISILWYGDTGRKYQYKVETSLDGVRFTTAVDRSDNTKAQLVEDDMSATARYVRINCLGKSGGSYSIWEIKLEGNRVVSATEEEIGALRTTVDQAKKDLASLDPDGYTIDSYTDYTVAVDSAEQLLTQEIISSSAVKDMQSTIDAAKQGLTERRLVLSQDFNGIESVEELKDAGWTVENTAPAVVEVVDGTVKLTQGAKTGDGNTVGIYADLTDENLSGKVYIQARIRSDNPKTGICAPMLYKDSITSTAVATVQFRDEGNIKVYSTYGSGSMTGSLGTFAPEEWHTVCVVLQEDGKNIEFFLDGVSKGTYSTRVRLEGDDILKFVRFYSNDNNESRGLAEFYVDDVLIYQEDTNGTDIPAPVQTKIACVGDSITYGSGGSKNYGGTGSRVDEEDRYPTQLENILGDDQYNVENFGVSGACMLADGTDNDGSVKGYSKLKEYTDSKEFQPDIVVIMLGTNDSKALNWDAYRENYVSDALDMIKEYEALESTPQVYIATSPKVQPGNTNYGIQPDVLEQQIIYLQRQIALAADVGFIDVHKATEDATTAQFPDNVHGNQAGYALIAEAVSQALMAPDVPKASAITEVTDITATALCGSVPELPLLVEVTYADSTKGVAAVTWDLSEVSFDHEGEEVEVSGSLVGLAIPVSATVTVEANDVAPHREALEKKLAEVGDISDDSYTVDSFSVLKTAVADAKEELSKSDTSTSAEALDACAARIDAAMEVLKERKVTFSEDFDAAGTRDDLSAWTFVENQGSVTLETDAEDPDNQYLKVYRTDMAQKGSAEAICAFEELTGKVYIQADVRNVTPEAMFAAPMVVKSVKNGIDETYAGTDIITAIQMRDGTTDKGPIKIYKTAGSSSTVSVGSVMAGADEWNTICLVIDVDSDTVEVYWNGFKVGNDSYPLRNETDSICTLRFYSDDYNKSEQDKRNAEGYLDNLIIYQEAA